MSELNTVATWLTGLFVGDATLHAVVADRIYDTLAPSTATYPLIVFQFQGGHDVATVSTERILVDGEWLVRAIDQAETFTDDLKTAADRINALLQGQSGSPAGGTVYMADRRQPYQLVESDAGVQYRHLGGIYRILAI